MSFSVLFLVHPHIIITPPIAALHAAFPRLRRATACRPIGITDQCGTWTWRACRGAPAYIICPPSQCIQVFFGDSCSPKRNNFWHERQGSQHFPTHSCCVGERISRFFPRLHTACSESASRVPRLADRRQVDHEGRQKGDVVVHLSLLF